MKRGFMPPCPTGGSDPAACAHFAPAGRLSLLPARHDSHLWRNCARFRRAQTVLFRTGLMLPALHATGFVPDRSEVMTLNN